MKKHMAWRAEDIDFMVRNGFAERMTDHLSSNNRDTSRILVAKSGMVETFRLQGGLLFPRSVFLREFGVDPEQAGYVSEGIPFLTGLS